MGIYLLYIFIVLLQYLFFRDPKKRYRAKILYDDAKKENRRKRNFLILACIELILIASLRAGSVGADTETYLLGLENYKNISFLEIFTAPLVFPFDFESGYFFLTKVCAFLQFPPNLFLALIALLIYIPVFKYIYQHSEDACMSILAYIAFEIFSYSLGIFRQMIATGIIISGIKYIQDRKLFKYIVTVVIAMLFHVTAIIALPLYFLVRLNWKNKIWFFTVFILEGIALILGRKIIDLAVLVMPQFKGYVGSQYDIRGGGLTNLLFLNIVFVALYFILERKKVIEGKEAIMISQIALAILLQCCAYHMALFGRIVPYYSIALLVSVPYIAKKFIKKNKNRRFSITMAAYAFLLGVAVFRLMTDTAICPYVFFWQ